jgi:plasmid stability protein
LARGARQWHLKIRKLDDWVVEAFRAQARQAGRSLEAELRPTLTAIARERREALLDEVHAFRQGLRARYGEMAESTPLIREIGDEDIGGSWSTPVSR